MLIVECATTTTTFSFYLAYFSTVTILLILKQKPLRTVGVGFFTHYKPFLSTSDSITIKSL